MVPLLKMTNIVKCFGTVKALDGVNIQLQQGEILSLCGENGSGKSTLMKVLCGIYPHGDFEGEIVFDGQVVEVKTIAETEALGIAIIHQELTLVKELSVLENLFLGAEIETFGVLDFDRMHAEAVKLLKKVKLDVPPDTRVGDLGVGQQQLIEIAKALSKNARLLVLDEPTAPLTESETDILLELVNDLREEGVSCIYISHKLNEVKAISDQICVIRDGQHIGTRDAKSMTTDDIITMMVGREMKQLFPREEHDIGDIVLEVKNISAWSKANSHIRKVDDVSFVLRKGEILGVSGLVGAGRTELMECLFGCYQGRYSGEVYLQGQKLTLQSCHDALDAGIAMVPEDRKRHGIIPIMSVGENITLASLTAFTQSGVLNDVKEASAISESIKALTVKTPNADLAIKHLSGGNQQKAILARFLLVNPTVLILDEPTRGIDVGAKYEIYKLMFQLVKQGISVIMVSSELPEVLGISDRVLVMHEGKIKGDLINDNLSQEQIMDCALSEKVTA
ncbi:xylose ABC transporter ATP-binding protein [Photobacterium profundum]|uniref:Xylose import ATP-binding protein XylG n=1 Tax=Photobacterium profundum (strain SS9) TaxID=298386 RepID=XYLG_PHOPR|nr:xylose ABC transporter ATP-binding protein [Photobacterium profundum]Q6LUY1.1 RecName: Full=Xylose import ATP-binding protein XylG [Photobacterium profundum SS9]CAG18894.1 putative D-xylose transport ATP-binding protein xylG [Photobacterium profundum SS9]